LGEAVEGERVKRRLAAILAADVAGYSRLTGADEEGTIARLKALRRELIDPTIDTHGGRIVKTTGDGILAEFASVVDAVRWAVAIQRGMASRNGDMPPDKRIDFRVGIHLGDVVVEGGDLLGDGVNVAARLEGIAEPGAICLSGDAYRQVKGRIDLPVRDLGEQRLKNISEPIRVYAFPAPNPQPIEIAPSVASHVHSPRLSIVVMPFTNLGGDKEQDYFVDGITESLTTDLSRMSGGFVIARNTAFTYKGKSLDAREIGRQLGVRYVMEGSIQSGHDRLRINAQLIDAETGAHLWAERFDKQRSDLFEMQDEITARLTRAVGIELVAAESLRAQRERPNNMDAVDLTMRGKAIFNQSISLERIREARAFFEAALSLDGRNVEALLGFASTHTYEVNNSLSENPAEQLTIAEAAVSKALALSPNNAQAHLVQAIMLQASKSPDRALRECELAISLDRNLADAYARAGLLKIFLGRAEETEPEVAAAIRLSPRDPNLHDWHMIIGVANFLLGKLDGAVDHLRKSVELVPNFEFSYYMLAGALALLNRDKEAAEALAIGQRLAPGFNMSRYRDYPVGSNPIYLRQRELFYEGLRKAGVPGA
jgi:TolB-like protein/class 3 adenylate cyclase/Flp pilus assembly protein TadD